MKSKYEKELQKMKNKKNNKNIENKKLCNELQQVKIKLIVLKMSKFEKKEKYKV
jgi:hypothetical protein